MTAEVGAHRAPLQWDPFDLWTNVHPSLIKGTRAGVLLCGSAFETLVQAPGGASAGNLLSAWRGKTRPRCRICRPPTERYLCE